MLVSGNVLNLQPEKYPPTNPLEGYVKKLPGTSKRLFNQPSSRISKGHDPAEESAVAMCLLTDRRPGGMSGRPGRKLSGENHHLKFLFFRQMGAWKKYHLQTNKS